MEKISKVAKGLFYIQVLIYHDPCHVSFFQQCFFKTFGQVLQRVFLLHGVSAAVR